MSFFPDPRRRRATERRGASTSRRSIFRRILDAIRQRKFDRTHERQLAERRAFDREEDKPKREHRRVEATLRPYSGNVLRR